MPVDRRLAVARAREFTCTELDLAIHVVCSAFNAQTFPGVDTLDDVRQIVDVLANEKHRRDIRDITDQGTNDQR